MYRCPPLWPGQVYTSLLVSISIFVDILIRGQTRYKDMVLFGVAKLALLVYRWGPFPWFAMLLSTWLPCLWASKCTGTGLCPIYFYVWNRTCGLHISFLYAIYLYTHVYFFYFLFKHKGVRAEKIGKQIPNTYLKVAGKYPNI